MHKFERNKREGIRMYLNNERDESFPLGTLAMKGLYAELEAALLQCRFDPRTSNIFGAFLIDIASGRGLSTLSQYLCARFLHEPYFITEGMTRLTELPQALAISRLKTEFEMELESVQRFGRFRGMMVVDISGLERSEDAAFQHFVKHVAEYKNDIVFVFRTDPNIPQQFNYALQQISRWFFVRNVKIVERDNHHYYQKALDELETIGVPCPSELGEAICRMVDTVVDGTSFAGFETILLVAQEIAACAQRSGACVLTPDVLDMYTSSELYAAHTQATHSRKLGF